MKIETDSQTDDIEIPEVLAGNKSATSNGTGYVFFTISPIGRAFLERECLPGKRVIDIGAGYSNIPIKALEQGVTEYLANDLSSEHLKILVKRVRDVVSNEALNNLRLLPGKVPDILSKVEGQYDAILADKIIHFLNPKEIIQFINFAKSHLKIGGRIYVTAASPYSAVYNTAVKNPVLPEFLQKEKEDQEFPGHFTNIKSRLEQTMIAENYPQYQVPDEMVLFSRQQLAKLFNSHGIKVLDSYSMKIPHDSAKDWIFCEDEESNVVGITAVNQ